MSEEIPIQCGGTVPPDYLYVERSEDSRFEQHIRLNRWVNLYGARMMGKSSLAVRAQRNLRASEFAVGYATLEAVVHDENRPPSKSEFFSGLYDLWESDLGLNPISPMGHPTFEPSTNSAALGAGTAFRELVNRLLLSCGSNRLVLILDEIDVLRRLPYGSEIVNEFRLMHELRGQDPQRYGGLTLVLVGLRPLKALSEAPRGAAAQFCISVRLEDLPTHEVAVQTIRSALPRVPDIERAIERVLWHTRGQPILTMLMIDKWRLHDSPTLEEVEKIASDFAGRKVADTEVLFDNAKRLIMEDHKNCVTALSTYIGLLDRDPVSQQNVGSGADLLQVSGLVCTRDGKLEIKCPIFERAFDKNWAESCSSEFGSSPRQVRVAARKADRKKVCIINTGGTIGMVEHGTIVEAPDSAEEFLSYHPELAELADVEFDQVFAHDSINIYPAEWSFLAKYIYERRRNGYAGFVVAHGTDTMTFTASAVAFALGPNLSFPVVFTGAQTTPDKYHGDARTNLYRAVLTAQESLHEVVICFGDRVFRACRAQKRDDQRFDGFESPTYPELALITDEVNIRRELLRPAPHPGVDIQLQNKFMSGVLEISLYPGLEPDFFMSLLRPFDDGQGPRCNGVIIQTLGAGNIATRDPYSFLPFVRRTVHEQKIPVLVTSQYPPDPESYKKYSPAKEPVDVGAIHAGNMTSATAVSKFRWVLAQVEGIADDVARIDQVRRMMIEIDYVGELAKPTKK